MLTNQNSGFLLCGHHYSLAKKCKEVALAFFELKDEHLPCSIYWFFVRLPNGKKLKPNLVPLDKFENEIIIMYHKYIEQME
jgi:hypothetical protein